MRCKRLLEPLVTKSDQVDVSAIPSLMTNTAQPPNTTDTHTGSQAPSRQRPLQHSWHESFRWKQFSRASLTHGTENTTGWNYIVAEALQTPPAIWDARADIQHSTNKHPKFLVYIFNSYIQNQSPTSINSAVIMSSVFSNFNIFNSSWTSLAGIQKGCRVAFFFFFFLPI